jgi:hypothetical protein
LHVGAVPLQSAFETQATQMPVVGSQAGAVAPHFVLFVGEHTPQAPVGSQAGATPPHSPSPVQPRHVWVVASHTGVVPEHCAAERHPTHEPVTALQTGTVPMHCLTFVTEHAPHEPLGWQAGVDPPQSASLVHAWHVCAVRSQAGVDPPQFAFEVQATQDAVATSQAGVVPEQSATFVVEHEPHAPVGWQAGFAPPQSASEPHARHVCVPWSHAGFVPLQSPLTTQATQVAVAGSHTAVAPPHLVVFVAEHTPHVPLGWHAGVAAGHSPSLWHPRQTWVVVLHTGVAPLQVALEVHATQVPAAASQEGVAPEHFAVFVVEHAPHEPFAWQAGVEAPQSASPLQGPHVWFVVLHTGVVPPQSPFETHPTHAPVEARHAGVEPVHLLEFVAEHTPHAPVGSQAGVAPPQSTSPAQGRHVCVAGLQRGALPPQSAFAMQPTQVPAVTRHTGVLPPQRVELPAEHWPHAPDVSHTGVDGDAAHSPSPEQPRHVCVPPSHTGVAPEHCAFVRQRTQVPVAALQTGVPPTQAVAFVAEHWPHAPEDSHAGVAPPQSTSPAQARHVWVPALHTGLVPPHWVLFTHPTQVCVVVLHTGVAPPHCVAFVAEH